MRDCEPRGRAYRRQQKDKAKARAAKQMKLMGFEKEDITSESVGYWATTRCPCSCYMCGNPRKWWNEVTYQEHLAALNEKRQDYAWSRVHDNDLVSSMDVDEVTDG